LLFVRPDGTLQAAPFDLSTLAITGPGVPLAEGIEVNSLGRVDMALALDGTLMYMGGGGAPLYEMVWVTRDGTATVIDPAWPPSDVSAAALSPDASQLAVTVGSGPSAEVWIKQLESGRYSRFSLAGGGRSPSWSPDGRFVLYVSQEGNDRFALYIRPADQSAPAQLLYRDPARSIGFSSMTPDASWLAYQVAGDLLAVRLGSSGVAEGEPIPVATGPYPELNAALSPDGRWIAFAADEGGQYQVYVCAFPSDCEAKYQVSSDGGFAPVWGRNGRELFFVAPPSPSTRGLVLTSVEVRLGSSFDWGQSQALFDVSNFRLLGPDYTVGHYDVAPDGQRFVFARAVSSRPSQLVVVQNFFEVLRRAVAD
jgi:dipeptidyl aminopeptidase/acylaminoacyl peptidase